MSRVPRSGVLRGEEVVGHTHTPHHPLVLRGAMHRGRSPEKSGSHRKRSLDAVSGSLQLRQLQMLGRSLVRAGSLSS